MLTLGQAAKVARTSKTTLSRAIKAGRLSAERREDGSYQIDPAELSRVFTVTPETGDGSETVVRHATPNRNTSLTPATPDIELLTRQAALEAELDGLKAMVDELKQSRDQAQAQADKWQQQAERTTLALAAPGRPWWRRMAG